MGDFVVMLVVDMLTYVSVCSAISAIAPYKTLSHLTKKFSASTQRYPR